MFENTRSLIGYQLGRFYGQIVRTMPEKVTNFIRRSGLLRLLKNLLFPLFYTGKTIVVELQQPLAKHRMRLNWPWDKGYIDGTKETPLVWKMMLQHVREGSIAIDVGAHVGYYTMLLAKQVGVTGKVIAFEPLLKNFSALRENIEMNGYNNVFLENKAVSESRGMAQLHVVEWWDFPVASHIGTSKRVPAYTVEVETISLDDYAEEHGLPKIDFVKLDVEGAEGLVLKGMDKILKRDRPILIVELHDEESDALDIVRNSGYRVLALDENEPVTVEGIYQGHVLALPDDGSVAASG